MTTLVAPAVTRRRRAALAAVRLTMRPAMDALPMNRTGIRFARRIADVAAPLVGPPLAGTYVEQIQADGVRGEWVRGPGVTRRDAAMLYIHGSGYAICSARTHRGLVSHLSAAAGVPVLSLDYRLAPEHTFPAPAEDVRAGLDYLVSQGFAPGRVVVAGDSAGGHLAVDLALQNAVENRDQVAGLLLLSPLMDLSISLGAEADNEYRDPFLSPRSARRLVRLYAARDQLEHPRLRLVPTQEHVLPPVMIHAGGAEMFRRDAEVLAGQLADLGTACDLTIWPGQVHVFPAIVGTDVAQQAIRRSGEFIAQQLPR